MTWKPQDTIDALNKLCKWRSIFTGWFLGTRDIADEQARAYRDLCDDRFMQRVELNALVATLIDKRIITQEHFNRQLLKEANSLDEKYQRKFPGYKTYKDGVIIYDTKLAQETSKNWPK